MVAQAYNATLAPAEKNPGLQSSAYAAFNSISGHQGRELTIAPVQLKAELVASKAEKVTEQDGTMASRFGNRRLPTIDKEVRDTAVSL